MQYYIIVCDSSQLFHRYSSFFSAETTEVDQQSTSRLSRARERYKKKDQAPVPPSVSAPSLKSIALRLDSKNYQYSMSNAGLSHILLVIIFIALLNFLCGAMKQCCDSILEQKLLQQRGSGTYCEMPCATQEMGVRFPALFSPRTSRDCNIC